MKKEDEKKANEIAEYLNKPNGSNCLLPSKQAAIAMAHWKNEQFQLDIHEFCLHCERKTQGFGKGCAFRSLGGDYCDFIENLLKKYEL